MDFHEDGLLNYILYRNAYHGFFIKKFCYYHLLRKNRKYYNFNNIKYSFIHIMNVLIFSKNTKYEKDASNEIFIKLI